MDRDNPNPVASGKRYPLLQVRVSHEQLHDIHARAAAAGLSVPDYVRTACLGRPLTIRAVRDLPATLLHQLNRIGVNLNQLARHANAGRYRDAPIEAAIAELRGLIGELQDEPERR